MHVSEVDMLAASDSEIAARAEAQGEILVSKDEDFVVLRLPDRFALLWQRCGNATNAALTAWIDARWAQVEALLANGLWKFASAGFVARWNGQSGVRLHHGQVARNAGHREHWGRACSPGAGMLQLSR